MAFLLKVIKRPYEELALLAGGPGDVEMECGGVMGPNPLRALARYTIIQFGNLAIWYIGILAIIQWYNMVKWNTGDTTTRQTWVGGLGA